MSYVHQIHLMDSGNTSFVLKVQNLCEEMTKFESVKSGF